MARTFLDTSSESLTLAASPITAHPLSMACWFNSTRIDGLNQTLMSLHDLSAINTRISMLAGSGTGGDPIRVNVVEAGSGADVNSTTGFSAGTWHHAAMVSTAADDRAAYIDGGSKGTNTDSVTLTFGNLDEVSIGSRISTSRGAYMDGTVAEAAIWNVALTDDEVASLAAGYSPLMVQPSGLVCYLPMYASEDYDWISGSNFTANNTPTTAAHPPHIIMPSANRIILPAAVAAGQTVGTGLTTGLKLQRPKLVA